MLCLLCRKQKRLNYETKFQCIFDDSDETFSESLICKDCQDNNGINNRNYIIIEKKDTNEKLVYFCFSILYLNSALSDHNQFSQLK